MSSSKANTKKIKELEATIKQLQDEKEEFENEKDDAVMLQKILNYIDNNEAVPPSRSEDLEVKLLFNWFRENRHEKKIVDQLDEKYKCWFKSAIETKWELSYQAIKAYAKENGKKPPKSHTLGQWIRSQASNYKNKIKSMSKDEVEHRSKLRKLAKNYKCLGLDLD